MKTIVRLPNWVGDTLLALPALEGLAALGEELVLAGRVGPLSLIDHIAPGAPRVPLAGARRSPLDRIAAVRALRAARAQRCLLMTPSLSSAIEAWAARIEARIGWAEQGRRPLLTTPLVRPPRGAMHLAEEFKTLVATLGAAEFPAVPVLPLSTEAAEAAQRVWERDARAIPENARLVALCPGVQYGTAKRWPEQSFHALRERLEARGIAGFIVGSPEERVLADRVLAGAGTRWFNAAGAGGLRTAAELLRRARVAVCNDTGSMHLAAAAGVAVVALFGPSDPGWTRPLGDGHRVIRHRWDCAPCFCRHCPHGDPAPCMVAIGPEEVVRVVEEMLTRAPGGVDGSSSG